MDTGERWLDRLTRLNRRSWPEFMLHAGLRNWSDLFDTLARFQILFIEQNRSLAAAGLTVPCAWDGTVPGLPPNLDTVTWNARWPMESPRPVLCALAALVDRPFRGRGLSKAVIREMTTLAARHGLSGVLAPVRPTRKSEFPDEPIEDYALRRLPDGRLFDPWLRVHEDLGGTRLGIAPRALTVARSQGDWESWTGLVFPDTGDYRVPGALTRVHIDLERSWGTYTEPNIWYFHPVPRPGQELA